MESWPAERKGSEGRTAVPQRGTKHDVVEMARGNAEKFLADEAARSRRTTRRLWRRQRARALPRAWARPMRMSARHLAQSGLGNGRSMVVFEGGLPKKSDHRRFKIRSAEGKPDDFPLDAR